jgi:sugar diacid utilization regulator
MTTVRARPRKTNGTAKAPVAPARGDVEALRASVGLLQRENGTLRLLISIYDRLGALVLQGATATAITSALSELIDRRVLLLDPLLRPAESEDGSAPIAWEPNDAYVGRVLQTMAADRRPLRLPPLPVWGVDEGCVLAPVIVGDSTLGYLAILEPAAPSAADAPAEAELLAAQHAASVYALALMRERLATEVTTELRDELLEGLLLGQVSDDQAARERARRLGYDAALTYRVLVLLPSEEQGTGRPADSQWAAGSRRRLLDSVAHMVGDRAPGAIVSRVNDELVVLTADGAGPEAGDLARAVALYVASLYPDTPLTVGIGGPVHEPKEIGQSYAQARRAAEVALRFGRAGDVMTFEDLGLYRLLFHISDRTELRAFVDQTLGPLIEYDRKHKTDFVRTIATYLSNNNNLQATAREMYVHVNTAAYRIQRIQAITGLDLAKTEDCLLARVALMILEDTGLG